MLISEHLILSPLRVLPSRCTSAVTPPGKGRTETCVQQALACWVTSDLCILNLLGHVLSSLFTTLSLHFDVYFTFLKFFAFSKVQNQSTLLNSWMHRQTPTVREHRAQKLPSLLAWMLTRIHHRFPLPSKKSWLPGMFPCMLVDPYSFMKPVSFSHPWRARLLIL